MTFDDFVMKLLHDPGFREAIKKNPSHALIKAGVKKPSPQLVEALKEFDWASANKVAEAFVIGFT